MKDGNPFVSAVIVAAGGATRMGMNKMLLDLGSRTVFERTVDAFEECGAIDEVVIVSSKENTARYRELVRQNLYSKVTSIVSGGPTRQESVRIGLTACDRRADLVAVHDGARPLIKPDTIVKAVDLASEYGAAAAAIKSRDSIKTIDAEGFAVGTVDRDTTILVQTPQVFRRDMIVEAHERAAADGFSGTDDCALVERMGVRIKLVFLTYFNIKLTVPDDLALAKAVLTVRGKL